jgi:catechol 2,3-dioxygenase-like lactoylglutathione lyase family enzyme
MQDRISSVSIVIDAGGRPYTSVLVSDQDKALDFYTNVLGLEKRVENPTPDGPRFLTVGVKGDDFLLRAVHRAGRVPVPTPRRRRTTPRRPGSHDPWVPNRGG